MGANLIGSERIVRDTIALGLGWLAVLTSIGVSLDDPQKGCDAVLFLFAIWWIIQLAMLAGNAHYLCPAKGTPFQLEKTAELNPLLLSTLEENAKRSAGMRTRRVAMQLLVAAEAVALGATAGLKIFGDSPAQQGYGIGVIIACVILFLASSYCIWHSDRRLQLWPAPQVFIDSIAPEADNTLQQFSWKAYRSEHARQRDA